MGIPRWLPDDAGPGRSGLRGAPDGIGPIGSSGRDDSRRDALGWNHDAASVSHGAASVSRGADAVSHGAADDGGAGTSAVSGCGSVSQGASG